MKLCKRHVLSALGLAAVAALSGSLVGCGGDDDGGGSAPVTLELSQTNSDTVAHSTAAGFMAFGSALMMPLDGSGDRAGALASSSSGSWLPARVVTGLLQAMGAATPRSDARPLAVIDLGSTPCAVAGTTGMSFDDANNNGMLDAGEVFTFVFNNCQDDAARVTNGSLSGAITSISGTGTAFSASITLGSLLQRAVDGSHSLTLSGNALMGYRELSADVEQMTLRADGPVTAQVLTHLPFDDTVTLQSGFVQDTTHDYSNSRSTSTLTGVMESAKAGGSFAVATLTPIQLYDTDVYPHAGVVEMRGNTGVMNLRVLSSEQVQVELDANGDGVFESSTPQTWDWLF